MKLLKTVDVSFSP